VWDPFDGARGGGLAERFADTPNVELVDGIDDFPAGSANGITVLEVFEHLPDHVMAIELKRIERLLAPSGSLVITVPIEVGPASLCKNLARLASRTTHAGTGPATVLRATAGLPIERARDDYILSHVGFDHRRTLRVLQSAGWKVAARATSPLPGVGSVLNSQIGWRFVRAPQRARATGY
jgi:hypothetical protein